MRATIVFTKPLIRTESGITPGGAVFLDAVIESVDEATKTLHLRDLQQLEIDHVSGPKVHLWFENHIVCVFGVLIQPLVVKQ